MKFWNIFGCWWMFHHVSPTSNQHLSCTVPLGGNPAGHDRSMCGAAIAVIWSYFDDISHGDCIWKFPIHFDISLFSYRNQPSSGLPPYDHMSMTKITKLPKSWRLAQSRSTRCFCFETCASSLPLHISAHSSIPRCLETCWHIFMICSRTLASGKQTWVI